MVILHGGPPSDFRFCWISRQEDYVWCVLKLSHDMQKCGQLSVWWLSPRIPSATAFGDKRIFSCMTKQLENKRNTKNMYTQFQTNFHQPLQPKRLLIADVTQNQHIPLNWKGVQSKIKNLISYNAYDDGITRDSFQIEYGQHMNANRFLTAQNSIDSRRSVVVTWSLIPIHSFMMPASWLSYQTVITLLYFFIKIGTWLVDNFHAVSHKTQRSQTMATPNRDQNTQRTAEGNKSDTEGQSRYPTISTDNGLRVRTSTTGSEATDIHQYPTYPQGLQEFALLLRGKQTDNVLNTIEHDSGPERLPIPSEYSGWLCQVRSRNTKCDHHRASEDRHFNTSAISGAGETGVHAMHGQPQSHAVYSGESKGHDHPGDITEIWRLHSLTKPQTVTVSTQTIDNTLRVSADTLTMFAIAIIQALTIMCMIKCEPIIKLHTTKQSLKLPKELVS